MQDVRLLISNPGKGFDILGISETWLSDHLDSEISVPGYNMIRKDRLSNKQRGGLIIYYKEFLPFLRRLDLEHEDIECIWVEIMFVRASSILLCIAYRPPKSFSGWLTLFEQKMAQATSETKDVIILGDFNINLLDENIKGKRWIEAFNVCGMIQLISVPTRITDTTSSLIDHAYVLKPENIIYTGTINYGGSDHFPICVVYEKFSLNSQEQFHTHEFITYRSYKHFNEKEYLEDLSSIPWDIIDSTDLDIMLEKWYDLFLSVVNKHLPIKQRRVKSEINLNGLEMISKQQWT